MTASRHISVLVTSGSGPAECQQAVANVLNVMRTEAELLAVDFDTNGARSKHGYKSAVVLVSGAEAEAFAKNWRGTIQWRAQSNLRPKHKRANWFIGVFDLPASVRTPERIQASDVILDTFRAGGPGGQHQNTTDSAVRATHRPTGLSAVAREERSQHRNKALALERLQHLMAAQAAADEAAQKASRNELHYALERGNPVRCFKGHDFREVKGG
ncbi:putative peptide chain release factor [Roseobacter sp. SK209-2-6]|uniref:peptide chain release factor H n=1 Tax=Roseobacter sp. SK209-2-6 TaxID=388739 RepID=UPI0000F3C800|nr:peptide chain release factor H [Roseobacter sp. SK209-2-6]EBA18467.1 putative peptide chain release factor [Roseobacter sp. SK209-2-6]